jgi:excisionase family DNA binding protein
MNKCLPEYFESLHNALNATEVAQFLGIRRDTVYAYAKAGGLPSINIGARKTLLRFDPMALGQWIRARQNNIQIQRTEGAQQ